MKIPACGDAADVLNVDEALADVLRIGEIHPNSCIADCLRREEVGAFFLNCFRLDAAVVHAIIVYYAVRGGAVVVVPG